jgi:hypothetical protein
MARKKTTTIIFIIFLLIGVIHGLLSYSFFNFATWLLIGLWLIFTLKIFENIKRHREFNSPHNTAFFVILPLWVGIFYSIWGYYTGILGENLLGGLYFSIWSLIFAFPFIIYGSYSLYRCFKKYNVIYFGTKAVKARRLGYILSFSVLIFILSYWITFYGVIESFPLDLNLLLLLIATILIVIVFGFTNKRSSLPVLTRDYTRTTPTSHRQTTRTKTSNKTHTTKVKPTSKVRNLNNFKPRASYLSLDDFKCIFCFKLPKLPEDRGRGVVVCPKCANFKSLFTL